MNRPSCFATDDEWEAHLAESRARCGLPPRVEDPLVYDYVVGLLNVPTVASTTSAAASPPAAGGVVDGAAGPTAATPAADERRSTPPRQNPSSKKKATRAARANDTAQVAS